MDISLIAAMGNNMVIGKEGKMPWHLPDDLQYFMDKTQGHYVLMGRKTFHTYKKIMKDHKVLVVTNQKHFDGEYADVVSSIEEGIVKAALAGESELFVSGGAEIYAQTLDLADRLYLTMIRHDFEGDAFFPDVEFSKWELVSIVHHNKDEKHEFEFDYLIYERIW
ncbi:MAG: dihydrofolate reductase [Bacteroidales bacterium]|nr:dihydrofolate reductase [Bacteroidales bacterium]MCF8386875.1 dihydrofolate reductase [Bacteroidales bacterium]MCF8396562.1 dihydrofolate reductase [Bacteroidales bacterium]